MIATASRENLSLVENLGADELIDYKAANFEDGLAPVDVVFDTVGGILRERSAAVLKPNGRIISIARTAKLQQTQRSERPISSWSRIRRS